MGKQRAGTFAGIGSENEISRKVCIFLLRLIYYPLLQRGYIKYIFLLRPIYYPLLPSAAARTKIAIHHLIGIDFKMRLYYDRRPPIVMEGLLRMC